MRQDQLEMLKGLWDREGVPYECGTPLARYTTFKIGGPAALFACCDGEICVSICFM